MRRVRIVLPVVSALALTTLVAAPATAAVSVSGSSVVSNDVGDTLSPFCNATGDLDAPGASTPGDPCASMATMYVSAGGGSDTVDLSEVRADRFPVLRGVQVQVAEDPTIQTPAADTVYGSPLADLIRADYLDTITGGDGADLLIGGLTSGGGPGDDTIVDLVSNGVGSGGPGDDRFVQSLTAGGIDGGPGTDSWEWDFDKGTLGADVIIVLTADGLALTVDGEPLPKLQLTGLEQVYLTLMRRGAHSYDGSAFAGRQHVRGFASNDVLVGGGLDDVLQGGGDSDSLTGNGGSDVLEGGGGDDTIQSRDGVVDRVDCGEGSDTVVADAGDVVTGCESVQLPPATSPPAAPPPGTGTIKGPKSVVKPAKAKFTFSSPTAGATFQCKLDKKKWKSCASPYKVKTKKLDVGKHKLRVRAVLNGVVDPTPSKKRFTVKAG